MSRTRHPLAGLLAVLLLLTAAACARTADQRGIVDQFEVRLDVGPDGSVDVSEDIIARADAEGMIRVRRIFETRQADGLAFSSAAVDRRPVAQGDAGLSVELDDAPRLSVEWVKESTPGASHRLTLRYRALAAVGVRQFRARLVWPVLGSERGYDVRYTRITLALPEGVRFYDTTGIAEADWTVVRTPTGIIGTRHRVADSDTATLLAEFEFDPGLTREPTWEFRADRRREFWPAFASAALFILVIAVGVLLLLRMQYPKPTLAQDVSFSRAVADRRMVGRGLQLAGWTTLAVAAAGAALVRLTMESFGFWPQLIPASMAAGGVLFLFAALMYRR